MSDEIAAVRDMTIAITMMAANKSHPPSDYVLVPFNDPGEMTHERIILITFSRNRGRIKIEAFFLQQHYD